MSYPTIYPWQPTTGAYSPPPHCLAQATSGAHNQFPIRGPATQDRKTTANKACILVSLYKALLCGVFILPW